MRNKLKIGKWIRFTKPYEWMNEKRMGLKEDECFCDYCKSLMILKGEGAWHNFCDRCWNNEDKFCSNTREMLIKEYHLEDVAEIKSQIEKA